MINQYPLTNLYTAEYEVRHTGKLNGKTAEIFTMLGYRRQWSSTTSQGDIATYLVGGQLKLDRKSVV